MRSDNLVAAPPGALLQPLDDLPVRLHRRRQWYRLTTVLILAAELLALGYLMWFAGQHPEYGLGLFILVPHLAVLAVATGLGLWLAAAGSFRAGVRDAERRRLGHLAAFSWFEVWADDPAGPPDRR